MQLLTAATTIFSPERPLIPEERLNFNSMDNAT